MKEIYLHAIVVVEYVCKPVVLVICECHSNRTALLGGDARFLANIRKRAIAIVVIKNVGRGRKLFRWTVRMPLAAAALTVFGVPFHVPCDEQIQLAVIVVIENPAETDQ